MLCAAMRSLPCCGGVRPPVNVVSESYAQFGSITRLKAAKEELTAARSKVKRAAIAGRMRELKK
jgi:hypothetical protein